MSDRYGFSDHPPAPEGWPADFDPKDIPLDQHQAETVYEAARDVLTEAGVPYPRAVHLAEAIRKRAMGCS